ncbi:MAG: VTC domain-containing protein [Coriobacteriaceae bacterium]|nr:MAG: VTC domain-containing protein [Coriobacteriaceae bacterium]
MEAMQTPSVQLVFKRCEVKYLLDPGQRERLCRLMERSMVPDEYGASTIRSLYLDTPTLFFARRSAEHPLYKEKLRIRSYAPSRPEDEVFLELKKKHEGIVYKRRCRMVLRDAVALCAGRRVPKNQIQEEIAYTAMREGGVAPSAFIAYEREAFFGRDDRDLRLTLDSHVRARWSSLDLVSAEGEELLEPGCSLLEIKSPKAMPLWLVGFLSKERLRKTSFSKYGQACLRHLVGGTAGKVLVFPSRKSPAHLALIMDTKEACHA